MSNTAISLFSGMGGDSLGIIQAGYKLIAYCEKEKIFQNSHDENFKNCNLLGNGDITKVRDDEFNKYKGVDLIFAGFPCQGFSQAGKKLPNDPRNTLFREFVRATRIIKPKFIIGENVKGLLKRKTDTGDNYIDIIKNEFSNIGYNITYKVMKANLHLVPQKRERLIIVGIRNDIPIEYEFPEDLQDNTHLEHIVKFSMEGSIKMEPTNFDFSTIPEECILTDMNNCETEQNPHPNLRLLATDRNFVYKGKTYESRLTFGKRTPIGGEIIDIRRPCKTIICTYARCPRLFVPLRNKNGYYLRCLLPKELQQIQGFPKKFKVCGNKSKQIIQIGNAVPPPLIKSIIDNIHKSTR